MVNYNIIFNNFNIYNRISYFYSIYSVIIYFLKSIRELNVENYIGFLSRDAYFLYLLYQSMFPEMKEDIDYSYIYSSRNCYTNEYSDDYFNYLSTYTNKKKLILVDIYGSGITFLKFINKYKIKNIKLLFFNLRKDRFNININESILEGFYITKLGIYNKNDNFNQYSLETIFRAPHKKVNRMKKINDIFIPIHLEKDSDLGDIINDRYTQEIIKIYEKTIKYMPYHKNIRYFTLEHLGYLLKNNKPSEINIENINYKGLLVLDIDDVLTNVKDYQYIRNVIKKTYKNIIKVILLTSRQNPYSYGPKSINQNINPITDILNSINFEYEKYIIDIWYNPFTFINQEANFNIKKLNYSENKYVVINLVTKQYKINKNKVIFFDDSIENIKLCTKLNIKTNIVKKGEGFNLENMLYFDKFISEL